MSTPIRIAILDDHPAIREDYTRRINQMPGLEVVGTAAYASDLETLVADQPTDVALLDVRVPATPLDPAPYPIFATVPRLLELYPALSILIISMTAERVLIRELINSGASGYILKDDASAIYRLGDIIQLAYSGGVYLSPRVRQTLLHRQSQPAESLLTAEQLTALSLVAAHRDWSRADLASHLQISSPRARGLLVHACVQLDVPNLPLAIARAGQLGLLPLA